MEQGFFRQEHVNTLVTMKSLKDAKDFVTNAIDQFCDDHPGVHYENVTKARKACAKAKSPIDLAMDVQNFILAHPSEGLGVLKK